MKLRRFSILSIGILSVFLFVTVVSAASGLYTSFDFSENKLKSVYVEGKLDEGRVTGLAEYNYTQANAELNMTLIKKKLFGWDDSNISRCFDLYTYHTDSASCVLRSNASSGTYKSYLILNEKNDSYSLYGRYFLN